MPPPPPPHETSTVSNIVILAEYSLLETFCSFQVMPEHCNSAHDSYTIKKNMLDRTEHAEAEHRETIWLFYNQLWADEYDVTTCLYDEARMTSNVNDMTTHHVNDMT